MIADWPALLAAGVGLAAHLPAFVRRPLTVFQAREIVGRRFEDRAATFLAIVHAAVWTRPDSPYRALLRHAGCEQGDLESLVKREGVEGALRALLAQGVYLTVDEFRGRHELRRGQLNLQVDPSHFRNPHAARHFLVHSGGSRGPRTVSGWDLQFVRDRVANFCLTRAARGPARWRYAVWGIPGSGAIVHVLDTAGFGGIPDRWFSQLDPVSPDVAWRYRASVHLVRAVALASGVRLPRPVHAPPERPEPVLEWMAGVLSRGERPRLVAYTTAGVRLCEAASRAGIDLTGAELTVAGEPVTASRQAAIARTGARPMTWYAVAETGALADGCLAAAEPDQCHVFHDLAAVIQPEEAGARLDLPAAALLVTSLRPRAPFVFLNFAVGDAARLGAARCGCPLEGLGWPTGLSHIRSYEKLTGAGMTFFDTDVIQVLESVLPRRFGGTSTDYQLIEDEGPDGRPRLRLRIHPSVGPLDPDTAVETFLTALDDGSQTRRLMRAVWRDEALLEVERGAPLATASGKILHLHLRRRPTATG
jgi:hypothetical protein